MARTKQKNKAFAQAFPKTVPVMVGYLFLGAAYGILMIVNGFSMFWAVLMSIVVYAGSLQYAGINFLTASVSPAAAFLMALMINARHLFYGISMLGKYSDMGKWKPYLVFGLTDETFSVVCAEPWPKKEEDRKRFFWITFLNQCYWVAGTFLGTFVGKTAAFNTEGLDFALTALFLVIFTEQWLSADSHIPALTGLFCSAASLALFGAESFMIPAMIMILAVLSAGYGRNGRKGKTENTAEMKKRAHRQKEDI